MFPAVHLNWFAQRYVSAVVSRFQPQVLPISPWVKLPNKKYDISRPTSPAAWLVVPPS